MYSMKLLLDLSESIQADTDNLISYPEIAFVIFGSAGPLIIKTLTFIFQVGTCVSYIIFFDMYIIETIL